MSKVCPLISDPRGNAGSNPVVVNLTSCSARSDDFPNRGGIRTATHGHFIAAVVPIATLQVLTPATNGFLVWFDGGGDFGPAGYTFH
ncbi:MAG TPA: hypothetical protein VKJ00_01055 [Thermoanaerobaculia bacterium]|nr:hypothetical protein [Thermoanaerobaculia bacterium]